MSLTQYRIFADIVESGSLAATARNQHLSPSAISKQLNQLESRLGAKLIQRSTRSMQVTDTGQLFYRRCLDILAATELAETEVRDATGDQSGTLKLTLPEVMATPEMALLLGTFAEAHRAISFEVDVSNDPQNLIEKNLDVGFRVGPLRDSRLVASEIFRAEIVMAASPAYIEQYKVPENFEDLRGRTLLVADPVYLAPSVSGLTEESSVLQPDQFLKCGNVNMLLELALVGAGIALLWRGSARRHLDSGDLLELPSLIAHQRRPVSIVYISRDYLPTKTRLFIDHVKEFYRA